MDFRPFGRAVTRSPGIILRASGSLEGLLLVTDGAKNGIFVPG
jgi:hypothetical protein